jgi:hypothetical protein
MMHPRDVELANGTFLPQDTAAETDSGPAETGTNYTKWYDVKQWAASGNND